MANADGVLLTAQAKPWKGQADITAEVTPLKVTLENHRSEPLEVRYSQFALVSADGTERRALPPQQIQGTVPALGDGIDARIDNSGYLVAPYYGGLYRNIDPFRGVFDFDANYYNTYYGLWDTTANLPTADMLRVALPEGVLSPAGMVSGYLYFQRVPDRHQKITLRAKLRSPSSSQVVAELTVPFVVE